MKIKPLGFNIVVGIALVGSLGLASVDKTQRPAFMDLTKNIFVAYSAWVVGNRQDSERKG